MTLNDALVDFKASLTLSSDLVAAAHKTDAASNYIWSSDQRAAITQAAFLRLFVAWESFLESSFTLYMVGAPSAVGNNMSRFVTPRDQDHAYKMVLSDMRFVDWSRPDCLRKIGTLYFVEGEPFERVIAAIESDLRDLKTIRNAAAHLSSTTSTQLDALASRKLGRASQNITVYVLLMASDPSSGGTSTVFDSYMSLLDAAATNIANA